MIKKDNNGIRIDKWLWAVRIYRTRALATEACAGGKVKIDAATVKASRKIISGDMIQVRKGVVKHLYQHQLYHQVGVDQYYAIPIGEDSCLEQEDSQDNKDHSDEFLLTLQYWVLRI
ncbi:MAG: hypothetical protein H8E85_03050 [Candidatus Marinimicrobia bacterium]|nr:hypothetical protein [Candidatus Neomarinimicrobiota bacterium]